MHTYFLRTYTIDNGSGVFLEYIIYIYIVFLEYSRTYAIYIVFLEYSRKTTDELSIVLGKYVAEDGRITETCSAVK
jgi:hypothetical protein